jgi:hypothetical protein
MSCGNSQSGNHPWWDRSGLTRDEKDWEVCSEIRFSFILIGRLNPLGLEIILFVLFVCLIRNFLSSANMNVQLELFAFEVLLNFCSPLRICTYRY